ncbi:MAG: dihydrolipoyllysine-residue acetyltransferase [Xanthomonadales bacterium]|nr:dihydrolipoyllysine-residue acetyltransferase [Xanthomonadales bacterium]
MADIREATVPDIGDFADIPVIEVLVAVGDTVKADQGLVTLESDKATMEVPAPFAGIVRELKVKVGDNVSEGAVVAMIEAGDGATDTAAAAPQQEAPAAKPATSTQEASSEVVEARVPDIGDFKDIPVIELLVQVGDTVSVDQGLITLESDKATMEVPAPAAGTIESLQVKVGDTLSEGSLVAKIRTSSGGKSAPAPASENTAPKTAAPTPSPQPSAAAATPAPSAAAASDPSGLPPHASPGIRRYARELGVDLSQVRGSGRKGRIVREDVNGFVKQALARPAGAPAGGAAGGLSLLPWPKVDFSRFGEIDKQPLSRIKKISGANLARNWAMIPHVTHQEDADITEMEAFRKQVGSEQKDVKITPLVFLIKAVVKALQRFPSFNASLDETGENLVLKKYFHVGIAVDTPDGLVVPVLRDCDRKSLLDLARELGEVSARARDKKLRPDDMSGGCFSISSLGGIGGTSFTPIINAPEVAILGVCRSTLKPVWDGQSFQPRLLLPLSLSYDHRVIDGAEAARFAAFLAQQLSDVRRLLL